MVEVEIEAWKDKMIAEGKGDEFIKERVDREFEEVVDQCKADFKYAKQDEATIYKKLLERTDIPS